MAAAVIKRDFQVRGGTQQMIVRNTAGGWQHERPDHSRRDAQLASGLRALGHRLPFALFRGTDRRRLNVSFVLARDCKAALVQCDENTSNVSFAQCLITPRTRFKAVLRFVPELADILREFCCVHDGLRRHDHLTEARLYAVKGQNRPWSCNLRPDLRTETFKPPTHRRSRQLRLKSSCRSSDRSPSPCRSEHIQAQAARQVPMRSRAHGAALP
jgi:hypothetical protein